MIKLHVVKAFLFGSLTALSTAWCTLSYADTYTVKTYNGLPNMMQSLTYQDASGDTESNSADYQVDSDSYSKTKSLNTSFKISSIDFYVSKPLSSTMTEMDEYRCSFVFSGSTSFENKDMVVINVAPANSNDRPKISSMTINGEAVSAYTECNSIYRSVTTN